MEFEKTGQAATQNKQMGGITFPVNSRRSKYARGSAFTSSSGRGKAPDETHLAWALEVESGRHTTMPRPNKTASSGQEGSDAEKAKDAFDAALRVYTKTFADVLADQRNESQELQESIQQRCLEEAQVLLQSRRRLTEIPNCTWASFPFLCPALSCCFSSDSLPRVDVPGEQNRNVTTLADAWHMRHIGVRHRSWKIHERVAPKRRACYEEAACQCCGQGKLLLRIKQRLMTYMQGLCAETNFESLMSGGFLILHWSGTPGHRDSATSSSEQADPPKHWFTQIALWYKKPWRPTFALMHATSNEELPLVWTGEGHKRLESVELRCSKNVAGLLDVQCQFWFYDLALDLEYEWSVEVLQMSTLHRAAVHWDQVKAMRLNKPGHCLWKGLSQENVRRPRPPPAYQLFLSQNVPVEPDRKRQRRAASSSADGEYVNLEGDEQGLVDTLFGDESEAEEEAAEEEDFSEEDVADTALQSVFEKLASAEPRAEPLHTHDSEELPPEVLLPVPVLEHPGKWGPFGFSLKQPRTGAKPGGPNMALMRHTAHITGRISAQHAKN